MNSILPQATNSLGFNNLGQGGAQGMSVQNNINNINLNINLAKSGGYGSQPFIPMQQKVMRGATAPLGKERNKKPY